MRVFWITMGILGRNHRSCIPPCVSKVAAPRWSHPTNEDLFAGALGWSRRLERIDSGHIICVFALTMAQGAGCAYAQPQMPAGQLVREVIYNEQHDHQRHGYWRYWIEKRSPAGTRLEEQVETADGPIDRLTQSNGQLLTPAEQGQEQERLERLLSSPSEQARHLRQYDEDEERIGRILALLADAFIYEYDGEENGCARLRYHPNPDYPAGSIEARIFHAMSGTLWVDERAKRLTKAEGHVDENVDFGFGILGRVYKGSWFRLARVQVSATDWKTEGLEVHINVRALLVKNFARDTSEMRGGFEPVPAGMTLAQGLALLNGQADGDGATIEAAVRPRQ